MTEQDELITELFNVEAIEVDTTGTFEDFKMETVNMDTLSRNRSASKRMWNGRTADVPGGATIRLWESLQRPLWLGSPNLDARAGSANFRFTFVNTDLRLYAVTIMGYIWGPRSILAEGGPRRPVGGGLFGS